MDPTYSNNLQTEDETRVLGALLEAFHPVLTLQEIASAYCRAGSDPYKASEILCQLQESNSTIYIPENDDEMNITQAEKSSHEDIAKDSTYLYGNKGSKPKKLSATVGSVSTILGKAYVRPTSSKKDTVEATKPLKLELPKSVDGLETGSVKLKEHSDHQDIEEFLFSMLGDGFKLKMDVIRQVLGQCGYDVKKTMEELLALSGKAVDKGKKTDYDVSEKGTSFLLPSKHTGKLPDAALSLLKDHNKSSPNERKAIEPTSLYKERSDLPREVLLALFNGPGIFEEEPKKRLEWGLNRTRVIGQKVVTKPLDDVIFKSPSDLVNMAYYNEHVGDEDESFRLLRQDAKEHWDRMKECYEAAVEAYSSGDRAKANSLLEEGKHHNRMAREADEKSAMEILEAKKPDTENDVPLDLHAHCARDSLRLLKKHLVSLANLTMFRYLKVIVNTDADDATKGKRKRMVVKLLERESVKWAEEEGNPGTILIRLSEVDPSKFTFTKDRQ